LSGDTLIARGAGEISPLPVRQFATIEIADGGKMAAKRIAGGGKKELTMARCA